MITADDITSDGGINCQQCKEILAGLINAQSSGKLMYQWGDRKIQYGSGSELRQGIADWTKKVRQSCGGRNSGVKFTSVKFKTTPQMTGAEGAEYEKFN